MFAPTISERRAVVVALHPIVRLSLQQQHVQVALEEKGGTALADFHLLAPGMLSIDDLSTMYVWRRPEVSYDIGHDIPHNIKQRVQQLIGDMLHAEATLEAGGGVAPYVVRGTGDDSLQQRECLSFLCSLGIVKQAAHGTWASYWHAD